MISSRMILLVDDIDLPVNGSIWTRIRTARSQWAWPRRLYECYGSEYITTSTFSSVHYPSEFSLTYAETIYKRTRYESGDNSDSSE
jgi:hypothetical protein